MSEKLMKICKKCSSEFDSRECKNCKKIRAAAWYAANREKINARSAERYALNRERLKPYYAAQYAANSEKIKTRMVAQYSANPEKILARNAAWRAANPEKERAIRGKWRSENPEKIRVYSLNRRAREKMAEGELSADLAAKLIKLQKGKCACCHEPLGKDYHLDHIVPLVLGGSNTDDNIQLLKAKCNLKKNSKHPVEFMRSLGFLL